MIHWGESNTLRYTVRATDNGEEREFEVIVRRARRIEAVDTKFVVSYRGRELAFRWIDDDGEVPDNWTHRMIRYAITEIDTLVSKGA